MLQTLNPLDRLTEQYGGKLELICTRHKTLMLACLAYQLAHNRPMNDAIEQIDPNAYLPESLAAALVELDCLPQSDYLKLIETLAAQLRSVI